MTQVGGSGLVGSGLLLEGALVEPCETHGSNSANRLREWLEHSNAFKVAVALCIMHLGDAEAWSLIFGPKSANSRICWQSFGTCSPSNVRA